MVVALHVGYVAENNGRSYAPGGFAGVDVFFVLSGFLITSILAGEWDRTGGVSLGNFYARRAFRLLPALGVLLVAQVVLAAHFGARPGDEAGAVLSVALYASNITQSAHMFMPAELAHTWSLALEEQFYFVWPVVCIAIVSRGGRRRAGAQPSLATTLVVTLAMINLARILTWWTLGYPSAYFLPYAHADGLVIGCVLAFAHRSGRLPAKGSAVAGWIGAVFLIGFTFLWFQGRDANAIYYGGFTLVSLAAAALIHSVLAGDRGLSAVLSWRPLVAVGRVSYGLYLWHVLILIVLQRHLHGVGPRSLALIGLALSAAATALSWYVVERPALRLKDRYRSVAPVEAISTDPG